MTETSLSTGADLARRLATIALAPGATPDGILNELHGLPGKVRNLNRQEATTHQDSATVVYIDDPQSQKPNFGSIVVLNIEPSNDAISFVDKLRIDRWGRDESQTVTERGYGEDVKLAWVDFCRSFGLGQFALPDQPVYFRIWYRAGAENAFMVIGSASAIREALSYALIGTLGTA